MQQHIYHWLKDKANYVYYNSKEELGYSNFYNRFNKAFVKSMIHKEDHEPASFYVVKKIKNREYEVKKEHFRVGKNTGKSLNQEFYRTLQELVDKIYLFNEYNNLSKEMKIEMFYKHLGNAINTFSKKKYFEKYDPLSYKKIINKHDIDLLQKNGYQGQVDDLLERIITEMSSAGSYYKDIEEIGFFYPAQYKHNLFSNKHYLFEINPYKYKVKLTEKYVYKFLFKYFVTEYMLDNKACIENYDENIELHHAIKYNENVAYFNPFILLNESFKLDENFESIASWLNDNFKKDGHKLFYNNLFNTISFLTFWIITAQFQSLFNEIILKKYYSKNMTRKEFITVLIDDYKSYLCKTLEGCFLDESEASKNEDIEKKKTEYSILNKMIIYYGENKVSKNKKITPDDLDIINEFEKRIFESLQFTIDLYFHRQISLDLLHRNSLKWIKKELKEYKVPQKFHKSFNQILLDTITFCTNSNMKKTFNLHIEQVHANVTKKQLEKEYNYEFVDENFT